MAVPPFGKTRKTAKYHAPSGPNSPGRMPKSMTGGEGAPPKSPKGTPAPATEDTFARRVEVRDYDPSATKRGT